MYISGGWVEGRGLVVRYGIVVGWLGREGGYDIVRQGDYDLSLSFGIKLTRLKMKQQR